MNGTVNPKINVKILDAETVDKRLEQHEYKVVYSGSIAACNQWCRNMGFDFVIEREQLFGGYYCETKTGTCFIFDL